MFCRKCGNVLPDDARFCSYCGEKRDDAPHAARPSCGVPHAGNVGTAYGAAYGGPIQDSDNPINSLGLGGMIVGIFGIWMCLVPVIGLIIGIVGIVLSSIALSRRARCRMNGFAVAGLILSIFAVMPSIAYFMIFFIMNVAVSVPGGAGVI